MGGKQAKFGNSNANVMNNLEIKDDAAKFCINTINIKCNSLSVSHIYIT